MRSALALILTAMVCICAPALSAGAAAQSGDLSFGLGYSTLKGPTGDVSLGLEELGGDKDIATALTYRGGPQGEAGSWTVSRSPEMSTGGLTYRVSARVQDWDYLPYESRGADVSVMRDLPVGPRTQIGVGLFAEYDDITRIGSTSAILNRDIGAGGSAGLKLQSRFESGSFDPVLPQGSRLRIETNARLAGLGERKFVSLEIATRMESPLGERMALSSRLVAGAVRGLDGDAVSVLHRAFQGEVAPRGFEYGGLGPRDLVTGEPLGGVNYYAGSLELRRQVSDMPVVVAGFVDFGSSWSVPGASGTDFEDGHAVRAAVGISVEFASDIGELRIAFAEPIARESHDRVQRVSVALATRF